MNIAFDFDGTITAYPKRMNIMAQAFAAAGHKVYVLTSAAGELPPADRPAEVAKRLVKYGFTCPHELVCCDGHTKGRQCARLVIDMIVDDEESYLRYVANHSPNTIRLKVHR